VHDVVTNQIMVELNFKWFTHLQKMVLEGTLSVSPYSAQPLNKRMATQTTQREKIKYDHTTNVATIVRT
jgi:hypothetical protein